MQQCAHTSVVKDCTKSWAPSVSRLRRTDSQSVSAGKAIESPSASSVSLATMVILQQGFKYGVLSFVPKPIVIADGLDQ